MFEPNTNIFNINQHQQTAGDKWNEMKSTNDYGLSNEVMSNIDDIGKNLGITIKPKPADKDKMDNFFDKNKIAERKNIEFIESQNKATAEAEAKQESEQKELWQREDDIRKETQEREDNQYQRLIDDMRKAGINPNLFMGSPASGGGITSGTAKNLTRTENEKERLLDLLMLELKQAFEGDQNAKDRAISLINSVLGVAGNFVPHTTIKK